MMDQAPQHYDVSNADRGSSALVRVIAVDTTQNPLQVLKIVVEGLAVNAHMGLWLTPYSGISMVPRMSPFDLVYLDDEQQVCGVAAILPGMEPVPQKGRVASALVLPLHTISLLRLDKGVRISFFRVTEEDEEKEVGSPHDALEPNSENPSVAAVPDASVRSRTGDSQSLQDESVTRNSRTQSRRRPLTEDELKIVETLKSYLVEPLAALEFAEQAKPVELTAQTTAESVTPATAKSAPSSSNEPIRREPEDTALSATAEEAGSSHSMDEYSKAESRRKTMPRRMRRPRVPFSARAHSELVQQGTAERAAAEKQRAGTTVPTSEDFAHLADSRTKTIRAATPVEPALQATGSTLAEPSEATRSGKAEDAIHLPVHAKAPNAEQKRESTAKLAPAPTAPSESRAIGNASLSQETNAERRLERRASPVKPAQSDTRSERPPANPVRDNTPKRRPAIALPERQRLLIQPFHAIKKPTPPPPAPPGMLTRLMRHVCTGTRSLTNRRSALRKVVPDLVAFPWGRRNSPAFQVGNLSSTGLYLMTEERWPRGAVVTLALQRAGVRETRHAHRVLVEAGTIRLGAHGLGLMFVLPAPEDIRLWEELPNSPWFSAGPETVVREFRAARALTFLRQISPGGYEDFRNLLQKEFSFHRLSSAVDIVFMAEEIIALEPGTFKYRAHPKLIREILTLGSWADAEIVQELWAGLLATACTTEGNEVLNLTFAEKLSQFTAVHAQLLTTICAGIVHASETRKNEKPSETSSTIQKIMENTGIRNALKIHHTIVQLCEFGLLEMQTGNSWAGEMPQIRANPTMLGLEFYMRCARVDSRFHLLQFK